MPGPDCFFCFMVPEALSHVPGGALLAYAGLGPGQEFLPYLLALLAWVGVTLVAILQWPVTALLRRLSRARGENPGERESESGTALVTESAGDVRHDKS